MAEYYMLIGRGGLTLKVRTQTGRLARRRMFSHKRDGGWDQKF